MQIEHAHTPTKGRFYFIEEGEERAEMTYTMAGELLMIIDHTQVDDRLKGRGVGKALVMAGVEFARNNHWRILPLCPFAKAIFEKSHELSDFYHHG